MSDRPPRKRTSRTDLNMSVAGLQKPFASSEPPPAIPKEDRDLMAEVAGAEELLQRGKPIAPATLGKLLAKCTLALTRWHGRWDPETKEPKWYAGSSNGGIDSAKMVAVWEVQNELMTDMLATIEKNDESNEAQAEDNKATREAVEKMMHASKLQRWISAATTIAMLACMVLISNWSRETLETAKSAKAMLSTTLNATSLDHEARVAKSKAEDDLDLGALLEADKKAIKAEAALAQAQRQVAPTPKIRDEAIRKLQAVKRRAVKMKVHIDDGPHPAD